MITNIFNLISQLNNWGPTKKELNLEILNNGILSILDKLQFKGFINFIYNPYTKRVLITNNNIKYITVKSKPSRKIFVNKNPYILSLGTFITKPKNNNKLELLLYVE